jgi:DNA (cytosine-5)-methyltransferase 1
LSGTVADRKRLLRVTAGGVRNSYISVAGHYDFFPDSCFGTNGGGRADRGDVGGTNGLVTIALDGLGKSIHTGIATDPKTGKPRAHFRDRSWVREFFERHEIQAGDLLAIEKRGSHRYRLYPFSTAARHQHDWHELLADEPPGDGPTVLELFAGAGGMALGFKDAGFRTTLAVEWDEEACETLRANITPRVAQCAIEEIDEFPRADVVAGGPPCQGFSNLGERVPADPRRQLWRHFLRAVEDAGPIAFVMENVPPLLKSQEYVEIKRIAESLGYGVQGRVLNAADYGAPQTRRRAIVIGMRGGTPTFPEPTHVDPNKRDLLSAGLERWRTVRDAIADLPPVPDDSNWHIGRNPTAMSLERYRCVPPGGNRWDLPEHLMPECWKRKTKGGTDLFGRLWWDRPSVTIRTEFYKPEKGRYLHPEEHRPITHREAARLQGFPDSFDFKGRRIGVGIQIGNAVPPPLAKALASHLFQQIHSITSHGD